MKVGVVILNQRVIHVDGAVFFIHVDATADIGRVAFNGCTIFHIEDASTAIDVNTAGAGFGKVRVFAPVAANRNTIKRNRAIVLHVDAAATATLEAVDNQTAGVGRIPPLGISAIVALKQDFLLHA